MQFGGVPLPPAPVIIFGTPSTEAQPREGELPGRRISGWLWHGFPTNGRERGKGTVRRAEARESRGRRPYLC